jgi:hypothetical protein
LLEFDHAFLRFKFGIGGQTVPLLSVDGLPLSLIARRKRAGLLVVQTEVPFVVSMNSELLGLVDFLNSWPFMPFEVINCSSCF